MRLKFDWIEKGDKFIYRAGFLVFWECISDEYKYGRGLRKDIIKYKIDFSCDEVIKEKTYVSSSRLKREKFGIGDSGRWEKNKKRFFDVLFDPETTGYGVF